jgi:flavorubredoxin
VKYDFADLTIKNIAGIVEPSRIKNIIINHIENDHASSLDRIMALAPQATIHISEKGFKGLQRFFDLSAWNVKTVKSGDTLSIGTRTLEFLETPMLHWPDSMVTYSRQDRILFTQDAFGQHVASAGRFDDEFEKSDSAAELEDAVIDYYANILMPFGQMIKTKIAEIQAKGFDIDIIAPDHGLIWRANPGKVLNMYMDMANGKANESVAIIYDTMWQSTEKMAVPIAEGIRAEGLDCRVVKLRATPMSVAIKEFWKSRGALIGSPTLNNILYPSVAEFLTHLRGLRPKNRIVGAFGSYGWGGGAVRDAYEEFKKMGLQAVEPGYQIPYRPSRADEEGAFEFGRNFARQVIEYHKGF